MKVLTRLAKLLVIAAFVVYMCAPGAVSPSVSADDGGHCYENFVFCQGPPPCDCPIGNCSGCFIKSGEPGCGICSGDVIIQ